MDPRARIDALIAAHGFVLLDGGLASELEARGEDLDDPLWSARALLGHRDAVAAVHRDFARAGADIVATATYQASFAGLAREGLTPHAIVELLRGAVTLARDATAGADPSRPSPLIAASIGSYGAYLADGSEYRGYAAADAAMLRDFHEPRLRALESCADLIAFETIPSRVEARVLAELLDPAGPPAWLSFSCASPTTLADGSSLTATAAELAGCDALLAVGVNCVAPASVLASIAALRRGCDKAILVYPNSGERFVDRRRGWAGDAADPLAFAEAARTWLAAGATWIGGCCRTSPAHVRALAGLRGGARG